MHQRNWKALEIYAILIDLNNQLSKRLHYKQPEFLRNAQEKSIGPLKFYLDAFLMKSLQKRYEKKPRQCWIRMERKTALRKTASAEKMHRQKTVESRENYNRQSTKKTIRAENTKLLQ